MKEINESIPRELLDNLVTKKPMFSTLKEVTEAALLDPEISEEDKKRCRAILDSGYLDKLVEVVDESIEAQIDAFLDAQIKQAVEDGLLPATIKVPKLKSKSKKNVRQKVKDTIHKGKDTQD